VGNVKVGLDREMVIQTALELLNEVGLDGLTTRRLADKLGVKQPAIYWHFRNKRDLLDEMAARMVSDGRTPGPMTRDTWMHSFKEDARGFRRALLQYRDGARIHAGTRPDARMFASLNRRVHAMCEAGLSAPDAVRALMVMSHYVVGSVIEEQASNENTRAMMHESFTPDPDTYPTLAHGVSIMRHDDAAVGFEFGLDALVTGLAAKLDATAAVGSAPIFETY
jgi:TetR/AcrR family tetracycline transcriptional repressor